MLCPETWKFPWPALKLDRKVIIDQSNKLGRMREETTSKPVRMLSVVFPANVSQFVRALEEDLSVDTGLVYCVKEFPVGEMLKKEFVDAFVNRGTLYAYGSIANARTANCVELTPNGELFMCLNTVTYQELKFKVNSTVFSRKGDSVVIMVDLKSSNTGEQIQNVNLAFDLTLRWIPPTNVNFKVSRTSNVQVSGSSIAEYLRSVCGLQVDNIPNGWRTISRHNEFISLIKSNNSDLENNGTVSCSQDEMLEYIGVLALDCKSTSIEYGSDSYMIEKYERKTDNVTVCHRWGIITPEETDNSIMRLFELINDRENIPWVGVYAQEITNIPTDRRGHGVSMNQGNSYAMLITKQTVYWNKYNGCI